MKPIVLLLPLAAFLASCEEIEGKPVATSNNDATVELLFVVDDCRVYRFYDKYNYRYLTTCTGSVSWEESVGSGKSRHTVQQQIQTER